MGNFPASTKLFEIFCFFLGDWFTNPILYKVVGRFPVFPNERGARDGTGFGAKIINIKWLIDEFDFTFNIV